MSLLRDVLAKKNTGGGIEPPNELSLSSGRGIKKYAASIRSSSGASIRSLGSIAESIASFYSILGGSRIPKRRRAEVSRLGVPKWYHSDPPPPNDIEGTERVALDYLGNFTAAHASSLSDPETGPWLSLILYSFATPQSRLPRYFSDARVQGEVRLLLTKPTNVASIDVWLFAKAESVLEITDAPLFQYYANLWKISKGLPTSEGTTTSGVIVGFKGKLPSGSYIFPFEFPSLPQDVPVDLPIEEVEREGSARVFLPPTSSIHKVGGFDGRVTYSAGIDVKYDDMWSINRALDMTFAYYPRARPLPREAVPFPFIPTREDWPSRREVVGGWTLTPFGGRGRFKDEKIEVEGILGVQTPEVYAPGQIARFGLLLWSTSSAALQALSYSDSFDVVFIRSEMYGPDVLRPRNSARRNRNLVRLSQGRIWRTDDGPPSDDKMPRLRPELPSSMAREEKFNDSQVSTIIRRAAHTPLHQSFTAAEGEPEPSLSGKSDTKVPTDDGTTIAGADKNHVADNREDGGGKRPRTPSPTPSLKDLDKGSEVEDVIRLDGDVRVTHGIPPSFRYKYMGCEYIIAMTITHPEYSHISPSGPGIQTETPLWVVTDAPDAPAAEHADHGSNTTLEELPITGEVVKVSADAVRSQCTLGEPTKKERPTSQAKRVVTF